MSTITIDIPEALQKDWEEMSREQRCSMSEVALDAVRRRIALKKFEEVCRLIRPYAEAQGFYTDEDVFKAIS